MTDDKLIAARLALAQVADLVTEAIKKQTTSLMMRTSGETDLYIANKYLVSIREIAQDAAEATLDKVETRT